METVVTALDVRNSKEGSIIMVMLLELVPNVFARNHVKSFGQGYFSVVQDVSGELTSLKMDDSLETA